jgi:hypothetical protein
MKDWVRKALTKTVARKGPRGKEQTIVIPPSDTLVLIVKFSVAMTLCLTALEITHVIVLQRWSSEVFSAISSLTGTILGVLIGQHS